MEVLDREEVNIAAFQEIVVEKAFPKFREKYGSIIDEIIETGK